MSKIVSKIIASGRVQSSAPNFQEIEKKMAYSPFRKVYATISNGLFIKFNKKCYRLNKTIAEQFTKLIEDWANEKEEVNLKSKSNNAEYLR